MKNNIIVLCLSNNYSKKICQKLSNELDMFFVDVNDILEYEMINDNMLQSAGKDYFERQQVKTIKSLAQYDNSLLRANIELILKDNNIQVFRQNCLTLYIKLSKSLLNQFESKDNFEITRPIFAAEQEDVFCSQNCDILIDAVNDDESTIKIIKNALKSYCENAEKRK